MAQQIERNQEATIYIGNLDERCTESLVWELMLQAGPVGKFCNDFNRMHLNTNFFFTIKPCSECSFTKRQSDTDASKLWICRIFNRRRCRLRH
jgi:RNA recognition motif-containing protein